MGCQPDPPGDIAIAKDAQGRLLVLAALCPGDWVQKVMVDRWDSDESFEEPVEVFWAFKRSPTSEKHDSLRARYGAVPEGFEESTPPTPFDGLVMLDVVAGVASGGTNRYWLEFDAAEIPVGGAWSLKRDVLADASSFEAGARDDC
jgi:hypothetical protein